MGSPPVGGVCGVGGAVPGAVVFPAGMAGVAVVPPDPDSLN